MSAPTGPFGEHDTVAGPPPSSVSASTAASASRASGDGAARARTTVLPRVEVVDRRPVLVPDERLRYEGIGKLGEGGVGEVLRARDNDIGREVAVKRLRPVARGTASMVRFVDEIRTVGQLEHPNIVPIHDVGVGDDGEPFFVMKYVAGETLESIVRKLAAGDAETHRRFPFERRVDIFVGILEAVAYAHSRGIIHRDLKPANIMVGEFGEVVVMDWGLAKQIRGDAVDLAALATSIGPMPTGGAEVGRTTAGALLGTPFYMSPEQARGEAADERSDVYSLSVLFHELLCLKHYLAGNTSVEKVLEGVKNKKPPMANMVASRHQPPVPVELAWYVNRGLAKDPEDRHASAEAMLECLRRRREGHIPIQCHVTLVKRLGTEWVRFVDRHPMGITVGLAALLVAAIGLAIRAAL